MTLFKNLLIVSLIPFATSCAMMFNEKNVDVTINSNPQGADIFIEGFNYGQTPKTINIAPKDYNVVLSKEGYGKAEIQLESWVAVRRNKAEGKRCLADAVGTMLLIPYYSFYWSGKCLDFKQGEYMANIPYTAKQETSNPANSRSNYDSYDHYNHYNQRNNYY